MKTFSNPGLPKQASGVSLNQLSSSSHLLCSHGGTLTRRTQVKKKLGARATPSEGGERRNQETGRQGVVARALGWKAGEVAPGCH